MNIGDRVYYQDTPVDPRCPEFGTVTGGDGRHIHVLWEHTGETTDCLMNPARAHDRRGGHVGRGWA